MKKTTFIASLTLLALGMTMNIGAQASVPLIGISKIVPHPALDAVEQGIQDEFKAQGIAATFDLQSANGDMSTAATIANKFKNANVALAIGIATPTAQALAQAIKDIPVIYSAVTDPVAARLVTSHTQGGANVTGISDMTPVRDQIKLLVAMQPSIKRIGHVYSSGEANAAELAKTVEAVCKELGLSFVPATVANSAEVRTATQSIVNRVDAFYVSTDNTVVSALTALTDVANQRRKPVMSADPSSAEGIPVLAAWGFDYYKMGRATGRLAIEILQGKKTSEIPTRYMTDPKDVELLINLDVAKQLGIRIPANILSSAAKVVENKVLRQQ